MWQNAIISEKPHLVINHCLMTIKVKFFASLSEELGIRERLLPWESTMTAEEVWNDIADRPLPQNLLCAINHEYAQLSQLVVDGDEVAFFPPVNGG